MKKLLLLLIALFSYGTMCQAQQNVLAASKSLKPEQETRQMSVKKAPKAEQNSVAYWVDAQAHFDEWGWFDPSQLTPASFQANVTFDGDEVTFDSMLDFGFFEITSTQPIKGHYDAEARTITISTPAYDSEKPISDYAQVGTMSHYGDPVTLVLFAGNFSDTPNASGQYGLSTVDELIFDVSDDLSTLTPRTGFGSYGFYSTTGGNAGFINFYKTATFVKRVEEACLLASPSSLVIAGQDVIEMSLVRRTITLSNIGMTGTAFSFTTSDEHLLVNNAEDYLEAGETLTINVEFRPLEAGEFNGAIDFVDENGSTTTVTVSANVAVQPDFSDIVKRGNISFSYSEDMPFALDNETTGFPVAISTNQLENAVQSTLVANVVVPRGKTGVLSWKGVTVATNPQAVTSIILDDSETVYTNYSDAYNMPLIERSIDNSIVLQTGMHTVSFNILINRNNYLAGYTDRPYVMYVYDFAFDLTDEAPNSAILKTESVDFGNHYVDKLDITDKATVLLLNTGVEPLKVTGISNDGVFSGIVDDATADYGTDLSVTLTFNTANAGEYNGEVTISTTAGDFVVSCTATAEQIPTDYSPIVEAGDFSFNTSLDYPFIVDGEKAYSSTSHLPIVNGKLVSWLEAYFVIPDGGEGVLSWTGYNSSKDWLYFMGDPSFNDGTRIIIDDEIMKEFCGEASASSDEFAPELLTFAPGRHKIRFEYEKISSFPQGDDRFMLEALTLEGSGLNSDIQTIDTDKQVVRTDIYTPAGERLGQVRQGINIICYTYSDGTTHTIKALIK